MAPSSALQTVDELSEHISQLLQRSSQTEAETRSITLQYLALKGQIEQIKASVVEERMKQQVCADEIAHLKELAVPRRSGKDSLHHGRDSGYPHTSTSLEMHVCYGDDWREPRGPFPPDFPAHQAKRNVLRRGDFEWRHEEGEHWFGVEP